MINDSVNLLPADFFIKKIKILKIFGFLYDFMEN